MDDLVSLLVYCLLMEMSKTVPWSIIYWMVGGSVIACISVMCLVSVCIDE
jgi:hypothetical protein